jgi:hypothetical protein
MKQFLFWPEIKWEKNFHLLISSLVFHKKGRSKTYEGEQKKFINSSFACKEKTSQARKKKNKLKIDITNIPLNLNLLRCNKTFILIYPERKNPEKELHMTRVVEWKKATEWKWNAQQLFSLFNLHFYASLRLSTLTLGYFILLPTEKVLFGFTHAVVDRMALNGVQRRIQKYFEMDGKFWVCSCLNMNFWGVFWKFRFSG